MIISPPFLPPRIANETDDVYLNRAMTPAGNGAYPFGEDLAWHGGMHLEAPPHNNPAREKVRAIADGTVIYVHPPTARPQDISKHVLGYKNWTDDGCVVIRHETAIGANANEKETVVCFFSIYMHLNFIAPAIQVDQAIHRKSEIGQAGTFEGNLNTLHFEIICDDSNLEKLIGRQIPALNINRNGRTDAVFGQMYFHLPADTPVYVQRPPLHQTNAGDSSPLGEELFIGMHYGSGNARISAWRPDGSTAFTSLPGTGKEYSLYAQAGEIVMAFRNAKAPTIPIHSAVYELLRFGRVLGPDNLTPADTPHWREIPTAKGTRWVNLNTSAIHCFSDADAPPWRSWSLLKADTSKDSRASLDVIASLPGLKQEHITTRAQAKTLVERDSIRPRLANAICKFSTEWQRSSVDAHWQWLTAEGPGPLHPPRLSSQTHMTEPEAEKFKSYIKALCFWDDAKIGISEKHWHFDPRAFIAHFRACGWISKEELRRIYQTTSNEIREKYRISLNTSTRKYLYHMNPLRMSHFMGQGAVESTSLTDMQEASMTGTKDGDKWMGIKKDPLSKIPEEDLGHWYGYLDSEDSPYFRLNSYNSRGKQIATPYIWRNGNLGGRDGQKYRGRGFKQLTGRYQYSAYWVFRGWLDPKKFDKNWWDDPAYKEKDQGSMKKIPANIDNPQVIATIPFNCLDSAGWYLIAERSKVMKQIDSDSFKIATTTSEKAKEKVIVDTVTFAINGGYHAQEERLAKTREAKEIFL